VSVRVAVAILLASCGAACGTDVSLGGTPDGGGPDAGAIDPSLDCQPCLEQGDCAPTATCGVFSGDSFCATVCASGSGCESDETCDTITTVGGTAIRACVPNGGMCTPESGPDVDGGPIDRCGILNGPSVTSACHSCGRYSSDCQANGCYGGWWCNTSTRKCQKPPQTCP
jgi:hypothetical protein